MKDVMSAEIHDALAGLQDGTLKMIYARHELDKGVVYCTLKQIKQPATDTEIKEAPMSAIKEHPASAAENLGAGAAGGAALGSVIGLAVGTGVLAPPAGAAGGAAIGAAIGRIIDSMSSSHSSDRP